ncbi:MAG TPA: phytanoyl-CoA dioxygenase family protein [Acidimicrobiales bacterium]|nr:phytanoyl-CoA dioxygenase family protein [Acidimicrobiales bacterium]
MTIDLRTRDDVDVETIEITEFFEGRLPDLAAERSALAVPGARELGVRPLTVETAAGSWTLSIDGETVRVDAGGSGGATATVRLDESEVTDIVHDRRTPMTFLAAGTLDMPEGELSDFLDWWVVLRSLLDDRAVHRAGDVTFNDRDGGDLDLQRSFSVDDDPAELAYYLGEAGYLHLTEVFTPAEMAQVSADMDAALPRYHDGDGRSWWATTAGGEQRAVRLQHFQEESAATAALLEDDRLLRLATLTGDGHVPRQQGGNKIEALVKPIGVVKGISDLPWHKDCSLGRHSSRCCSMTVGISVTGADERSGQLGVVAGSHRALVQPAFFRDSWGLPAVPLPTRTGDVTVHCSCTLHMSQAPVDRERRVMYTDFVLPPRDGDDPAPSSAGVIDEVRERAYKVVSQVPSTVRPGAPEGR